MNFDSATSSASENPHVQEKHLCSGPKSAAFSQLMPSEILIKLRALSGALDWGTLIPDL
jgi:hypothetical protein